MISFLLQGGRSADFNNKSHIYELFKNKKLLYVPFANQNYQKGLENFKKYLDISTTVVIASISNFANEVKNSDIIFICGGTYERLKNIFEKYHLKDILDKYLDSDKIYAGISAGAILFSSYGMGDKDVFLENGSYYNFKIVKGLGYLNINFCPHYDKAELVIFNDIIKEYKIDGYALEDDTAIYIQDDKIEVIKDDNKKSVYLLDSKNNYLLVPLYENK